MNRTLLILKIMQETANPLIPYGTPEDKRKKYVLKKILKPLPKMDHKMTGIPKVRKGNWIPSPTDKAFTNPTIPR